MILRSTGLRIPLRRIPSPYSSPLTKLWYTTSTADAPAPESAPACSNIKSHDKVLTHIHFDDLVSYHAISELQESIVSAHLKYKKTKDPRDRPAPCLITFNPFPIYTAGRRESHQEAQPHVQELIRQGKAEYFHSQRGGQTTFHGPGQLVSYPIIDLKRFEKDGVNYLRPKCYVSALEQSIINMLLEYGIQGRRTENTGVWVSEDEKIAALGVHVRRFITSHGVAVNVATDLSYFDDFIACGLNGKRTVSIESLGKLPVGEAGINRAAKVWSLHFARVFGFQSVEYKEGGTGYEYLMNGK